MKLFRNIIFALGALAAVATYTLRATGTQLFANNASTTLSSPISNSATSIALTSAAGFPTPSGGSYFYATIANVPETMREIVYCTFVSGNTVTCARGMDGTTAQAWAAGATFQIRPVAQTFRDVLNLIPPSPPYPLSSLSATGTPSSTTYLRGDGTWSTPSGAGIGTVTNFATTAGNGITSSVSNPTSTPILTLGLGAITPTSVSTGTVTATNFIGSGAGLSNTTVPLSALNASGTLSSGNYLAGNGVWGPVSATTFNGQPASYYTTTTNITEGSNQYYTVARAQTAALATPMTGLSTATSSTVLSTDTLLAAIGKLQAQVNSLFGSGTATVTWVSPTAPTVAGTGGTITCSATVAGISNTNVTWSVDGVAGGNSTVGLINTSGVYTAPTTTTPTIHTITAASTAQPTQFVTQRILTTAGNTTYNAKTTYGAAGNGSTDDTAAIMSCVTAAAGNIAYLPAGTYMINPTYVNNAGIDLPANTCLYLASGATLQTITQSINSQYRLVRIGSNNASVCGGVFIGDRVARALPDNSTGLGSSGPNDFENGDGIDINASAGNMIFGANIHDVCCDGAYIYNGATSFTISDTTSNHNRRQGISVVQANGGTIQYCTLTNTTGNDPACGIDMEPGGGNTVSNVTVNACTITGNAGGGIQLSADSGSSGPSYATITNNTITGNGGHDYGIGGIYCDDSSSYGTITSNVCSSNVAGGNNGGIVLNGVTHFVVNLNTCNSNAGYGLYFASCGTGTTFHGNTESGNTSGSVSNDGSATAN